MIGEMNALNRLTKEFMDAHWPNDRSSPIWTGPWNFDGELPNHDKQGCYALLHVSQIVYVGLGIGRGTEKYLNNGLGYRTKRYWKLNENKGAANRYVPRNEWKEITSIWTIGFDPEFAYLAAALEVFLIQRLNPPRNSLHRSF